MVPGQAWDGTTPIGAEYLTPGEVDPAAGVEVVCRVNGVVRQQSTTRLLVFDVPTLVSYISTFTTLPPATWCSPGRRWRRHGHAAPVFLPDVDVVETEIEGIGTTCNTVRTSRGPV